MKNLNKYLKIKGNRKDGYELWFEIGCQSFEINMGPIKRSKGDAAWFRKNLSTALNKLIEDINK